MDYMHFTFDGVSSKKYNLYIENKGEDLVFPSQPNFDNKIVSPLFQGTNYLAGVDKKEREFNFKCWADSLYRDQVEEMIAWLSVDKISKLVLDYNPNFYYNVKVSSITDFTHLAVNNDAIYDELGKEIKSNSINYSFNLKFITIGNAAAISRSDFTIVDLETEYDISNEFLLPLGFWDLGTSEIKLFNYYDLPMPLEFNIRHALDFKIALNNTEYYNYDNIDLDYINDSTLINLKTETGIASYNGNLVEAQVLSTNYVNKGPMLIPSGNKTTLYGTATWVEEEVI